MTVNILDIIIHEDGMYGKSISILLDKMPEFLYERHGKWLIAEDSGFYSFYYYQKAVGRWQAFGGRKFEIPLIDGEVITATGDWWDGVPRELDIPKTLGIGYSTEERLKSCYVFTHGYFRFDLMEAWIEKHGPSDNYYKYKPNHEDYMKHIICGTRNK